MVDIATKLPVEVILTSRESTTNHIKLFQSKLVVVYKTKIVRFKRMLAEYLLFLLVLNTVNNRCLCLEKFTLFTTKNIYIFKSSTIFVINWVILLSNTQQT